MEDQN
jgi:hypothetical protein